MASALDGRPGRARKSSLRILLVEDHSRIAEVTRRLLVSFGHKVEVAHSQAAALRLFEADSIDLLISDIQLPDGSGWELLPLLLQCRRSLAAIALSGLSDPLSRRRSREAGFRVHLTKPVNPRVLQQTIDRLREEPPHVKKKKQPPINADKRG